MNFRRRNATVDAFTMMRTPTSVAAAVVSTGAILALGLAAGTAMGAQGGTAPRPRVVVSNPGNADQAPRQVAQRPAQPAVNRAHNVEVGIPAVAFTEAVVAVEGHLRTPVLLADPTVTGAIRVVGAGHGNDCRGDLTQGVVTWLDCTVSTTAVRNAQIVVTLSDGRRVTKAITAG